MADMLTSHEQTILRVDPREATAYGRSWLVKTANSYFRVAHTLNRYFVTKLEHHNGRTRHEAITYPGDSWTGHTLVLQVGAPMILFAADGSGVVRTTTVVEIRS
jgi:hypothetical protein